MIRSQNIYNDHFHYDGLAFINDAQANALSNVIVCEGDVLLNITGDSVARCCQVPKGVIPARVNQHVAIIRPDEGKLDPAYLRYTLVSPEYQQHLLVLASAGATRNALTKGMIETLQLQLPSLSEQKRIAHVLGTLDDKIELNRRMNATLEAMSRAIFKSWFVDFDPVRQKAAGKQPVGMDAETAALFPDSFEDSELGEVPTGWEVYELGELIELAYGKALKATDRKEGDVPVFGSNGQVGFHDVALAEGPGIIVGRKGNPGVVKWAASAFFPIDTTFYVTLKPTCSSLHFMFHALGLQNLGSLGADSAVPGLNRNLAYQSKQVLPPNTLVSQFDKISKVIFDSVESYKKQARTLAALRDTLLPKLLSGEIRVPEAEEAVEEAVG